LEALFFTVQVGVYNRPVKQEKLPGFTELFTSKSEKGQIRYSSGKFQLVEEAKNRRKEAIEKGVADAFVVAYYKGKRITLADANQLISRLGNSVFEEKNTEITISENEGGGNLNQGEAIEILQVVTIPEKIYKFEQVVEEQKVMEVLEVLNQNGIFTYNAATGKISSNHWKESEINLNLMQAILEMNEVIVKDNKLKPITFALKSTNWSGSFGNWILHCPYEFTPLNTKEIKFFPRTSEEAEELKIIAKELLISIYE